MSISPQTILAPTIHRAKQLEKECNNPLAQSLTLSNFIKALHERYGSRRVVDQQEARHIVAALVAQTELCYFDYLDAQSEVVEEISSFFITLKRNGVKIDEFSYVKEKASELHLLFEKYDHFLEEHHLADQGDVELEMLNLLKKSATTTRSFGEIIVDDFSFHEVHFTASNTEAAILELLQKRGSHASTKKETQDSSTNFFQPKPTPFHQSDEVSSALKIVRRLLEEGAEAEEIIVVTTSIDEYAALFESQLEQYGLKGYSSKGVALKYYLPLLKGASFDEQDLLEARKRYEHVKSETAQKVARLENMGLHVPAEQLLEVALEESYVKSHVAEGVLLSEPNQLLSLHHVKHLIFMGTDISHFPPKSRESFLVTQKQKQKLLHGNSIYLSSQYQYLHMKAIADNLYIVTATYKGKTKLARSLMITETCKDFDITAYGAQHELLRENKRVENSEITPYLDALQEEEATAYDGIDVGSFKVTSLSASQLNSYATCPRKYFMNKILRLKAPQERDDGFDAMQKGSIIHRCFELFATAVKKEEIILGSSVTELLQKEMQHVAIIAYQEFLAGNERDTAIEENIHHQLFLQELQQGLDNRSVNTGHLQNFLNYIIKNRVMLDDFRSSEFEMEFMMDEKYHPVDDEKSAFIKGVIDRIDILEDEIRIVDYKSKKMDAKIDKKKLEQMQNLQDMQLALYILYAKRQYGDKNIESYLQTFKSKYGSSEFVKVATFEVGKEGEYVHYDDDFEQRLITEIAMIKSAIEAGDFHYDDSDEEQCGWCEFQLMCQRK